MKKFLDYRIAYAAFYIWLDILPHWVTKGQRLQVELLCSWRYFGFIFLCFVASFFKNMGPLLKPNLYVQLYVLFYMKHVIRKTYFLLKPQDVSEEKFLCSSSCAWITEHFPLLFMNSTCFDTLHWQLKTFFVYPLLCLFLFCQPCL